MPAATDGFGPVRTCVGCRQRDSQSAMVRLVLRTGDDRHAATGVTISRTAPGRGAWLHPDPSCLELARRRRSIPRALRVPVPSLEIDFAALTAAVGDAADGADATATGPGD